MHPKTIRDEGFWVQKTLLDPGFTKRISEFDFHRLPSLWPSVLWSDFASLRCSSIMKPCCCNRCGMWLSIVKLKNARPFLKKTDWMGAISESFDDILYSRWWIRSSLQFYTEEYCPEIAPQVGHALFFFFLRDSASSRCSFNTQTCYWPVNN